MHIRDHARRGGRARARKLSPARRREIARRAALARWGASVVGIPVLEVGRRIEAYARNPLADALRESYWRSKGDRGWRAVRSASLRERCTASWAWVVRRLARA